MNGDKRKKEHTDLFEMLPQAIARFKKNVIEPFFTSPSDINADKSLPLRAEVFTEEQLEQHAKALSDRHTLIT
ncbi:MAG: hypothetical protein ABUT20_49945, partial [Bacteroidota bacterium]